ncbi:hypothetical protein SAMN02910298_01744 [Pseudobutyrivibrio sp. YE44]|uniref:hypothetical protein n=1 Tax=Pseudobutyrivibrio sp. YE44 TaxID=1520802 RepID=UPI00087F6A34|nr:hypothetical protein [Pseudobutyrivibrio sp. YE44]SDB35390.1 hypothetical protein SAMN02910298_01744 [Pseudobutyrivibrio sp. YE44]
MKKTRLIALGTAALLLVGCGSGNKTSVTSKEVAAPEKEVSDINVVSAEEFDAAYPGAVILPEGVEDVVYTLNTSDNPISEVTFKADGVDYTLKIKQTDDYNEDITGLDKSKEVSFDMDTYTGPFLDLNFQFWVDDKTYQDGDTTYKVSPWHGHVNGIHYDYALIVSGTDLDGFDITTMVNKIHDCYLAYVTKQGNDAVYNPSEFPDGTYFSDVTMIKNITIDGDILTVEYDRLYPRGVEVPGVIYGTGDTPFIYNSTISGNVSEIECVFKDLTGYNDDGSFIFEERSYSLDKITHYTFGDKGEGSPTELTFDLVGGKITKVTVY